MGGPSNQRGCSKCESPNKSKKATNKCNKNKEAQSKVVVQFAENQIGCNGDSLSIL